jgi:hypothetical protein
LKIGDWRLPIEGLTIGEWRSTDRRLAIRQSPIGHQCPLGTPSIGNRALGTPSIGNRALGTPSIGNRALVNPPIGNRQSPIGN